MEEVEEGLRHWVVGGAVDVGPVQEDLAEPMQCSGDFISTSILVEEAQHVTTDHGVYAVFEVGEECLWLLVSGYDGDWRLMGKMLAIKRSLPARVHLHSDIATSGP